jgi:hypothetical protein
MCPEKQFLSIYLDGELPSPWRERMEQHIESCSQCRKNFNIYKKTSEILNGVEKSAGTDAEYTAAMETAKSRVWEKINSRALDERTEHRMRLFFYTRVPRTALAAMAGAVAAAVIICVMFFFVPNYRNSGVQPILSSAAENFEGITVSSDYDLDIPDITPVSSMNELIHYLENDDSSDIVIIKLPERKKFNRYGDPAFINAADYNRRSKN